MAGPPSLTLRAEQKVMVAVLVCLHPDRFPVSGELIVQDTIDCKKASNVSDLDQDRCAYRGNVRRAVHAIDFDSVVGGGRRFVTYPGPRRTVKDDDRRKRAVARRFSSGRGNVRPVGGPEIRSQEAVCRASVKPPQVRNVSKRRSLDIETYWLECSQVPMAMEQLGSMISQPQDLRDRNFTKSIDADSKMTGLSTLVLTIR